jgi:hypothetical protein
VSRVSRRHFASLAFASALLTGGLLAGAGTAVGAQYDGNVEVAGTVENIHVLKQTGGGRTPGSKTAYVRPGSSITIKNRFHIEDGPERFLTRITDHAPAGFEYVPGSARLSIGITNPWSSEDIPIVPEVAPGAISVVAPGGGWSLDSGDPEVVWNHSFVEFSVTYRAPQDAPGGAPSTTGVTFDVAGGPTNVGWTSTGLRVGVGDPSTSNSSLDFGSSLGGPVQQG